MVKKLQVESCSYVPVGTYWHATRDGQWSLCDSALLLLKVDLKLITSFSAIDDHKIDLYVEKFKS